MIVISALCVELVYQSSFPLFKQNKNKTKNRMVACVHCGREMHQICVLHYDHIWSEGFQCNGCLKAKSLSRKENKLTAKRKYFFLCVVHDVMM